MGKIFRFSVWAAIILLTTTGFRAYPVRNRWPITRADGTVWLRFTARPTFTTNNLDADDPLAGQAISFDILNQSIFDDFNNVTTSFLRFADSATDPAYNASTPENRILIVDFDIPSSCSGDAFGCASPTFDGGIFGCKIHLSAKALVTAKEWIRIMTHELGHCSGLDHPQNTEHAAMSYAGGGPRLEIDDKIGLTYLYPADPSYGQPTPTLGFQCTPKN
jgi:hypothetical protein